MIITPHHFAPLRKQKPNLVPQIPAQAYRCGSPSSASAASFCKSPIPILFQTNNPSIEEFSWRTNGEPPSLCLKLWPTLWCALDSTPSLRPNPAGVRAPGSVRLVSRDDKWCDTNGSRKCFRCDFFSCLTAYRIARKTTAKIIWQQDVGVSINMQK